MLTLLPTTEVADAIRAAEAADEVRETPPRLPERSTKRLRGLYWLPPCREKAVKNDVGHGLQPQGAVKRHFVPYIVPLYCAHMMIRYPMHHFA